MTELKLYKTTSKGLKLIGMSLPFILIGVWMIFESPEGTSKYIMGWVSTCFFGLGIPIGLFQSFDKRPQIIINESGIWDRNTNQDEIKWEQIEDAYPLDIYEQKFISIITDNTFVFEKKPYKLAAKINKAVGAQNLNLHLGQINIDENGLTELIHKLKNAEKKDRNKIIQNFKIIKSGFSLSMLVKIILYISISISLLLLSLTGITAFMIIMIVMGISAFTARWQPKNVTIRKYAGIATWFGLINIGLFLVTIKTYEHISVSVGKKISFEIEDFKSHNSCYPNNIKIVTKNLELNPLEEIFANRIDYSFTEQYYELKTINLFNKQRIYDQYTEEWE